MRQSAPCGGAVSLLVPTEVGRAFNPSTPHRMQRSESRVQRSKSHEREGFKLHRLRSLRCRTPVPGSSAAVAGLEPKIAAERIRPKNQFRQPASPGLFLKEPNQAD
jgi:hypothetical protein